MIRFRLKWNVLLSSIVCTCPHLSYVCFQVKNMFTSKRVSIIFASFSLLMMTIAPIFYCDNGFAMRFHPIRNKTIFVLVYTNKFAILEEIFFWLINCAIPVAFLVTNSICSTILVISLHRNSEWRNSVSSTNSTIVTNRDQKVARMVVVISSLFVCTDFPAFIITMVKPDFAQGGIYARLYLFIFFLVYIFSLCHCFVNSIIYYKMSTKYRAVFRQIFRLHRASL